MSEELRPEHNFRTQRAINLLTLLSFCFDVNRPSRGRAARGKPNAEIRKKVQKPKLRSGRIGDRTLDLSQSRRMQSERSTTELYARNHAAIASYMKSVCQDAKRAEVRRKLGDRCEGRALGGSSWSSGDHSPLLQ